MHTAVTGPTGDLGLAFSRQLAQKGFNVVLIGRNASKLQELGVELRTSSPFTSPPLRTLETTYVRTVSSNRCYLFHVGDKYKVQTKEVVLDFGAPKEKAFEELKQLAQQLEINVLGELISSRLCVVNVCSIANISSGRKLKCIYIAAWSVNNAGVSHEMPVYFAETSSAELNSILDVVRFTPFPQQCFAHILTLFEKSFL